MILIYGMPACPDCAYLDEQIEGNTRYKKINIGEKTADLKAFLKIRDTEKIFDAVRENGGIGIPCFVLEDGTVTLDPAEAGLKARLVDAAENAGTEAEKQGGVEGIDGCCGEGHC